MKFKIEKIIFCTILIFFSHSLPGEENYEQDPPCEWIEAEYVSINGDMAYMDTNKGVLKLKVVAYDAENDRYLVECIKCGEHYRTIDDAFR